MYQPVKLSKHEARVTRYVKQAASKDSARPVLQGLNVNGNLEAADGFRYHAARTPEPLTQFTDRIIEFDKQPPATGGYVEAGVIDGIFPDCKSLIPTTDPVIEFSVNPKYLIEALKELSDVPMLKIRVHSQYAPIEVLGVIETGNESTPVYALIMPMNVDDANNNWKP